MNLPDTSTEQGQREASVMLARLCGWEVEPDDYGKMWIKCPGEPYATTNLYHPVFMFLAWRVLNWANNQTFTGGTKLDTQMWWHNFVADLRLSKPEQAIKLFLDEILKLALTAGMVSK